MVEKFESGLNVLCSSGGTKAEVFVAHDYIARHIKGLIIILIPVHGCNSAEDFSASP